MKQKKGEPLTIEGLEAAILADGTTYEQLLENVPMADVLMHLAVPLFDMFPVSAQSTVLAIMTGMVMGDIEGETTEIEKTGGRLITSEDRMKLFMAHYHVAYRDTIAYRQQHPTRDGEEKKVN